MKQITHDDYLQFRERHSEVEIESVKVALRGPYHPSTNNPSLEYLPETDTVWSFPDRGDWATHSGNYRGNWSPYIPRNVIARYSQPGDVVLDQMVGSGTTLVECKLLGRRGIGVDVNLDAIMVARDRLFFEYTRPMDWPPEFEQKTYVGDARQLDMIDKESVDLVTTHPPYAGIITYSNRRVDGDLSSLRFNDFVEGIRSCAVEALRVLKPGGHCAILIGDTRKRLHFVPISLRILLAFLDVGFVLREDVIKRQWKTSSGLGRWRAREYSFLKIAHEHLYVFRKPAEGEKLTELRNSLRWWEDEGLPLVRQRSSRRRKPDVPVQAREQ